MSAAPVAVVFADSHLSKRTWKHRPIFGDSYWAFEQIVKYAIAHELPLIGAGDLFDRRVNEPDPIVWLQFWLRVLDEGDLTLFYIQGQHERDDTPWLRLGSATRHLHRDRISLGELEIYGLDYRGADCLRAELDGIPADCSVLVAHQTWADFMGDVTLPQGSFADIPRVKLLITGDFHQCVLTDCRGRDGQEMQVFSPGATHKCNIQEPDKHWFGVLDEYGGVETIALRSRKCDSFMVHNNDQAEEMLGNVAVWLEEAAKYAEDNVLPDNLRTPLWQVTYSHRVPDFPRRLGGVAGDRAHLFWKEIPEEREDRMAGSMPEREAGGALTLESCLAREVNPDEEPEVYGLAARLLAAANPELESQRWLQERLRDHQAEGNL